MTAELPLLLVEIRHEQDVVLVRQRARELAGFLGFDAQDQTRIATAVSEIARNAFEYAGGGRAEYRVSGRSPALLDIRITDQGPGITDLGAVLEGRYESATGMGLGIVGARRLMDRFAIESSDRGTSVTLMKAVPHLPGLTPALRADLTRRLSESAPRDPLSELESRNQELLRALEELRARQAEIERLNGELAETNRGVLALYAELDERALQLGRASELKSSFLSSISHELRTPLNAIHNLTRLLLERMDGDLTPEQERQVTMIRSSASALSEMVNDLLDLARIEAGKTVLRIAPFAVADLLGTVRGMLRPLLTSSSVALVVDPVPDELEMQSDQGRVSQILRNLVGNAVKFTERGEIRVTAWHDEATDQVVFRVQDTGIGIAPEDLERIFEEYAQVENRLQQRVSGTGLGLPLSRKLATLLGGTLEATSTEGIGSTFTVRLPRVCHPAAGAVAGEPPATSEMQHA